MKHEDAYLAGQRACATFLPDASRPIRETGRLLQDVLLRLTRDVQELQQRVDTMQQLPSAVEWIVDHFDGYSAHAAAALEAFYGKERVPAVTSRGDRARVVLFAQQVLEHHYDGDDCVQFFMGVQDSAPLSETEHALLSSALLLAMLAPLEHGCRRLLSEPWEEALLTETAEEFSYLFSFQRQILAPAFGQKLATLSMADRLLRQDPAGLYPKLDEESQLACRMLVRSQAKRARQREDLWLRSMLQQAKSEGRSVAELILPPAGQGTWYPVTLIALSVILSIGLAWLWGRWWSFLLLLIPVSELVMGWIDWLCLHSHPVRPLLRMELPDGIPVEGRTLCVIPALISKDTQPEQFAKKLESHLLVSRSAGKELRFGLLLDFPDSPFDPSSLLKGQLNAMEKAVEELNQKYPGACYLFYRKPVYSKRDQCWRGWERKRGALLELARFLRHQPSDICQLVGDPEGLINTKFLLTLDEDTRLLPDTAKKLVATMLCPFYQPQIDPQKRCVTAGYGVLQPAIETVLSSAQKAHFSQLVGGQAGMQPYAFASSERYRDLFDRGSYTGKGLLHIDAFLACLDHRFPTEQILSHDLLEGEYLRCGLTGDIFLQDETPSHALAYYRRLHRWTRGDWQTIFYLRSTVKDEFAQPVKNPFSILSKWKILDNLRRSLLPIATTILFWIGLCGSHGLWKGIALVTALLIYLQPLAAALIYHSVCLLRKGRLICTSGTGTTGCQTAVQLLLLPSTAWIQLWAGITATYRMLISKRGLLEWSVSGRDRTGNDLLRLFQRLLPAVAFGVAICVAATSIVGKLIGVLWILSPWILWHLGQPDARHVSFSGEERRFLLGEAAKLWRYFDTFLTETDHYLPPDNVQELPNCGVAHRTSPTNIGLSLLSCLAAVDLQLTTAERGIWLIERQLETLEQLERSHGHFYNWYATQTLEPLYPRYLSTVDSGNLCAALLALSSGLDDLGQAALSARAKALASAMDFAFLYDGNQHLFYIGWDAESEQYTNSWYDLMCSEARIASYVAIARGEVEARHWRYLSRAMTGSGSRYGMISWSGTSFEYFMPQLLLDAPQGSLLQESLSYCFIAQYADRKKFKGLWGVSESAYFALNRDGSYCYLANGTPALALKNDTGRRVVAPYASALILPFAPQRAVQNLKGLVAQGMSGEYGLYDGLDFTESEGSPVQTWMVHHQGMSLVAIDNALTDRLMVKRFMGIPEMSAYLALLEEAPPNTFAPIRKERAMNHRKQVNQPPQSPTESGTGYQKTTPMLRLYSDGALHTLLCTNGSGWCQFHGKQVFAGEHILSISAAVEKTIYPVFPCEEADKSLEWSVDDQGMTIQLFRNGFIVKQIIQVCRGLCGQLRTLEITNQNQQPLRLSLTMQPALLEEPDYQAHPAFAKLGIESEAYLNGVLFQRRPRIGAESLSIAICWQGQIAAWDTDRSHAAQPAQHTGAVCDPQLTLHLEVPPEEKRLFKLAFSVGEAKTAKACTEGILHGLQSIERAYDGQVAQQYGLTEVERKEANRLISAILASRHAKRPVRLPLPQELWPIGLSGDLPIAVMEVSLSSVARAAAYAAEHQFISRCGYHFDLVFWLWEEALEDELAKALQKRHIPVTFGGTGGLHMQKGPAEQWQTLCTAASVLLNDGVPLIQKDAPGALPDGVACAPENGSICWQWEEDRFVLQLQDRLPPRRWSHLLANECFGWLTDECGTGFLWYGNAHENQLTPWQGDPLANFGGEELLLRWGEEAVSLFAAQDGWRTMVTYSPGKAVWSKEKDGRAISLIAEVPLSRPCRSFHITISGFHGAVRLLWRITPLLGRRKQDARFVQVQEENGTLCLNNPVNQDFPQVLSLRAMDEKLDWQWETPETLALSCRIDGELTLLTSVSPLQLKLGDQLLQPLRNDWTQLSSPLTLQSPDPALNHYMSVWALYQVVACRLFARTGLYQCGGAYGFRDQLQDVCALIPTAPELARQQIVRAACHQFREGDVQHWWHPNGNGQPEWGIRTRISDDLLWLPYALSVWMETTGDRSLLQAKAPWLESPPLAPEEQERYEQPCITQDRNSLYEHGCAAIHCVLQRGTGCHDLLLMGTGDWNDGLNHIGAEGKGESVWLTWFASVVLSRWSSVAEKLGDSIRAARCLSRSKELASAADRAWDGAWYLRGYDDQGHPFGGMQCKDCQIDSIAQSFSAFAPNPQPERAKTAVLQAVQHLYDPESKTTALLKDGYQPGGSAGYIQSYPVGVRENGGQYTHAAVWLASACYQIGCPETGWQILRDLLPENHMASVYQGEPYVLAGDVSTSEGYQGRCGWSWYTGAAGWYYRTVLESLLGIHIREGVMTITPQLPEKWDGYHADLRLPELTIRLTVHRGAAEGMLLNGVPAGEILLDQYAGELEVTVFCK